MLITFEMITDNLNIKYQVFGKRENDTLIFMDKSVPNVTMHIRVKEDEIEIRRTGKVDMLQKHRLNTKLEGYYKDDTGIEFKISNITKELLILDNQIVIGYDYYLENEWQSYNKLKIIF